MKPASTFTNLVLAGVTVALVLNLWHVQPPTVVAASPIEQSECNNSRSIQVSGAAVVNVIPDRALIQLGVQSNASLPDAAVSDNYQQIQRVIAAVRALGIDAKDIATDNNIIYPVYENNDALVIRGYRIDNTISITLRDIHLADDTVLAAFKAGANEVQDVQFYTSDLRKYRDQARDLAVKAASEKAQALAAAAGTQTGCVLSINENTWSQYYGSWGGGRQTALWAQNVIQNASPSQGQTAQSDDSPISLGQIAVRAEVNLSYSLK